MARSPWKASLQTEPTDGQHVWLRLEPFGYSIEAWYHTATHDYTSLPGHLIGSGFGDAACNAPFYKRGQVQGDPVYATADASRWIGYDLNALCWELEDGIPCQGNTQLYAPPDSVTLQTHWFLQGGTSPAGDIAAALVFPAASNLYWKPYP